MLYDGRILDEYRDVLARAKFGIDAGKADALLESIVGEGIEVTDARFAGQLLTPTTRRSRT